MWLAKCIVQAPAVELGEAGETRTLHRSEFGRWRPVQTKSISMSGARTESCARRYKICVQTSMEADSLASHARVESLLLWTRRSLWRGNLKLRIQSDMHNYRLVRSGANVQVFVDGNAKLSVDANRRDEMRNYMASVGLTPDEINQKVHELYITNTTTFHGRR